MKEKSHIEIELVKFKALPVDVFSKKPLAKEFPEEFLERPFKIRIKSAIPNIQDKMLRFIVLYFDYRSPVNQIQEELDRINTALHYAGFRRKEGAWGKEVLDILHKDRVFTLQATAYMMKNGGSAWALIKTFEKRLYQNLQKIFEGSDEKGILKQTEEIQSALEMKKREFFGELYNLSQSMNYDRFFVKEQLYLSPEQMAEMLEDTPYENVYIEAG